MDKLQKLADRLQASIDFATEDNEDFEASGWYSQEGVLLNHNEAKLLVELVKNLAIHNVRLSCFHEVWQKWCESETTQEFDKWLHDKMHEA